ncbi:MAG: adenylosuccinate synthetase [Myxococcota bacterium]
MIDPRDGTVDAWAVVDLGFGDAGKGSVVDFLVRDRGAGLVVRFNGGAQAGHNVVTADGRHHTFAQFGAGSFVDGVQTHLGAAFVLHPGGLAVEARRLERVGVADPLGRLTVDARAAVITPFQQAACRLRELGRGPRAHGTTGVGVGEVRLDEASGCDDGVTAADLRSVDGLRTKLERQRARKLEEMAELRYLPGADDEYAVLADRGMVQIVLETWRSIPIAVLDPEASRERIAAARRVVLEGAQGVLLDQRWGFHPHTTWSDCTFAGALAEVPDRAVCRLGVTRAYATRHGLGPFPTGCDWRLPEPHNASDGWQGDFRVGPLDGVLLRYARQVVGSVDGVVVTCVDRVAEVPEWQVCVGYDTPEGPIDDLELGEPDDWAWREALGQQLASVQPRLAALDPVPYVAEVVQAPVVLTSVGPTASDKRWQGR